MGKDHWKLSDRFFYQGKLVVGVRIAWVAVILTFLACFNLGWAKLVEKDVATLVGPWFLGEALIS
jgi:hypothetical protein